MEWLKPLLPLLQTGLKMYASGQMIKKSSENAKAMAVKSSIIAFGSFSFLIFFVASILMTFIDLGRQFETHDGVHFSGMMLSALYLMSLGAVVLGSCFVAVKILGLQEQSKKAAEKVEVNPYASLVLFGEEFLKVLIQNLNQKPNAPSPTQDG